MLGAPPRRRIHALIRRSAFGSSMRHCCSCSCCSTRLCPSGAHAPPLLASRDVITCNSGISLSFSSPAPLLFSRRFICSAYAPTLPLLAKRKKRAGKLATSTRTTAHAYASALQGKPTSITSANASTDAPVAASPLPTESEKLVFTPLSSAGPPPTQQVKPSPPTSSVPTPSKPLERPRRRYSVPSAASDELTQQLRRELIQTRLRLAKAEETQAALYESVLAKLDETDRAAQQTATSIRYTGMALRCAHDNLEVELRRLMTIGLTPGEVDAAAIEAGARQYIRQNIGFHAEHVASEPSAVTVVDKATQSRDPIQRR